MYQYFAFNIVYSGIVFMYLYSLQTAPFRVRFRFVLLAMVSWLLPYELINRFSQDHPMVVSQTISNFNGTIKHAIVSQIDNDTYITLLNALTVMTVIGFLWFIKDLLSLKTKLQRLNRNCNLYKKIGNCKIYVTNNDEIFTVGLLNPKVYMGKKYINSVFVRSIISHELQHIKSNDQLWLLLITFIQRLLWWNPIVYLLAIKAREFIELSCDQACKQQSNDNQYQQDLAQILIESNHATNPLSSNFFGKTKHNINRIKQLSKEFKMNKKHKALMFTTALIPFVLLLFVSTASVSSDETSATKENPVEDINFDTMPIKENQAKIVLDTHLYMDDPDVAINPKDKNANLKTNFNTHKSFAANYVVNLDEKFSMESTNIKDFKIEVMPAVFQKDSLMFTTNISFKVLGENIELNPALAIRRHDTGHIILNDEKGRYIFELYITVRQ